MMRIVGAGLALFSALLAGCGSGGGTAGSANGPGPGSGSQLEAQPTRATVVVSTQASTAATALYAVEFKLHLPQGVTLPADPASGELPAGVLRLSNSESLAGARYLPSTATSRALVQVAILNPGGFAVGSLATLNCSVSQGTAVSAAEFSLDGFSARDADGAAIPGITPRLSVQTQ